MCTCENILRCPLPEASVEAILDTYEHKLQFWLGAPQVQKEKPKRKKSLYKQYICIQTITLLQLYSYTVIVIVQKNKTKLSQTSINQSFETYLIFVKYNTDGINAWKPYIAVFLSSSFFICERQPECGSILKCDVFLRRTSPTCFQAELVHKYFPTCFSCQYLLPPPPPLTPPDCVPERTNTNKP